MASKISHMRPHMEEVHNVVMAKKEKEKKKVPPPKKNGTAVCLIEHMKWNEKPSDQTPEADR